MLRTKSFAITDSDGINALLDKYPLAKGMHILVSNGWIVVPFEDGEPANRDQRIAAIKEQVNILADQREIIVQSQMALESIIEDRTAQLNELNANIEEMEKQPNTKGKTHKLNNMKEVAKMAEAALSQDGKQFAMNENEVRRLDINILKLKDRVNQI